MKTQIALGFILILMLYSSCHNKDEVSIALFFNPSHAFHLKKQSFLAEIQGDLLVDTIIPTSTVDKSLLIKCFDIDRSKEQSLRIRINERDTILLLNEMSNCISIFTSYDDHTAVTRRAMALEITKLKEGENFDSKSLFDSIATTKYNHQYDSIEINIKRDTCWCN